MKPPISHRPASPDDVAFLADSWADSYRTSYSAGPIPMPLYQGIMRRCIAWIFEERKPEVIIAYDPDGHPGRDIFGWIALERGLMAPQSIREGGKYVKRVMPLGPVVHYVYVRECFRKHGIARHLFKVAGIDLQSSWLFSAKTAASERITKRLAPHARFDPLLCRFPRKQELDASLSGEL